MLDFEMAFEVKKMFDDMLDESYPIVTIGTLTFYPSQILRECDPVAYNESLLDFEDSIIQNNIHSRDLDFDRMQSRMADAEMGDL
jgi:hypothetical protein